MELVLLSLSLYKLWSLLESMWCAFEGFCIWMSCIYLSGLAEFWVGFLVHLPALSKVEVLSVWWCSVVGAGRFLVVAHFLEVGRFANGLRYFPRRRVVCFDC